jgi:hypothetical protein
MSANQRVAIANPLSELEATLTQVGLAEALDVNVVQSVALDVNVVGGNVTIDAGDISIGAVELKNATDDTRATIFNYGNSNPLAVRLVDDMGDGIDVLTISGSLTTVDTVSLLSNTTRLTPGVDATDLGKSSGNATWSLGDVGVMAIAMRSATSNPNNSSSGARGYAPLQLDGNGMLYVNTTQSYGENSFGDGGDATAVGPTYAARTAAFLSAFNGGSSYDRVRTITGTLNAVSTGILASGLVSQFDDVAPTAITENQFGVLRMSANRNLYVTLRDAAGNERGLNIDSSGNLSATVTGTVTVNTISDFATETTLDLINAKLVSGTDIGDVTINNAAGSGVYVQPGTSTVWDISDRAARLVGKVGATLDAETTKVIGTVNIAAAQTLATLTNLAQLGGANVPIGAGLEATAIRVTLPTNGTGIIGLAAGTNAIGKLAANSGVDIGDVDVTSSPIDKSINGPGAPTIDSYTHKAINLAAGANQSLVTAPGANKQIWVYGVAYTVNVAGSVSFQDEDDTALSGIITHAVNGGMSHSPSGNFAMPIWKVATNKALEVDVVTSELDGWLTYAIVSV